MARMLDPLTDDELKKTTVVNLRKEYKKIADIYRKIVKICTRIILIMYLCSANYKLR